MTTKNNNSILWNGLAVLLWIGIFFAGLFPEPIFFKLRQLGGVTMHQAFINSHWFITFSCTGFLAWFVTQRSREAGVDSHLALGKGIQVAVLSLVAFLPVPIEILPGYFFILARFYYFLIMAVITAKMLCWLYLLQVVLNYHLFAGAEVLKDMPLLFPSARKQASAAPPAMSEDASDTPPTPANDEEKE